MHTEKSVKLANIPVSFIDFNLQHLFAEEFHVPQKQG